MFVCLEWSSELILALRSIHFFRNVTATCFNYVCIFNRPGAQFLHSLLQIYAHFCDPPVHYCNAVIAEASHSATKTAKLLNVAATLFAVWVARATYR